MSAENLNQYKKKQANFWKTVSLLDALLQSQLYRGASQGLQGRGPRLKTRLSQMIFPKSFFCWPGTAMHVIYATKSSLCVHGKAITALSSWSPGGCLSSKLSFKHSVLSKQRDESHTAFFCSQCLLGVRKVFLRNPLTSHPFHLLGQDQVVFPLLTNYWPRGAGWP